MAMDVVPRAPSRVPAQSMKCPPAEPDQRIAGKGAVDQVFVETENVEKLGEIGRGPIASYVCLGHADVPAQHEAAREPVIVELDRRRWTRKLATQSNNSPIG